MADDAGRGPLPEPRLLTQKEYADRKGWSKQYVNQLVRKGRIPLENGRIDPVAADAAMAKTRDPAQDSGFKTPPMPEETLKDQTGRSMTPTAQSSYAKVRTIREYYRALREQLEYEQLAGKLVPASEVEEACFYVTQEIKRGFQVAMMRAGQAVVTKFSLEEREVLEVFQAETDATLMEICERFKEKLMEIQEEQSLESDGIE